MKKYSVRSPVTPDIRKNLEAYDDILAGLLSARGITDMPAAERFLRPDYVLHTHDPFLLQDMDRVVDRIFAAIEKKEWIGIFSDYDADGIPGAVIFSDFFRKIGYENVIVYIPHRNDEGYGMNEMALDKLAAQDVKLLVTIDCGISNHKEVAYANTLGMDVIVTDHHLPKDELPPAFAVINPKRVDCPYPDKNLCGSGVIWKVVCALLIKGKETKLFDVPMGYEKWLLDMAGLATLSDMVPLTGENRVIASYGLQVMRKTRRPGLHKIFSILKVRQAEITEDDIAFLITPRINAASRMGHPRDAFLMLSSEDVTEAGALAEHLNTINDERKGVVGSMVKEIKKKIQERSDVLRNVIVLGSPEWKPSLLGLVANSFSDEHNRPVFLWGREGNGTSTMIKGSCRSGGDVHIVKLMEEAKDVFEEFGGHKGAGGFSISQDNIHLLEERLNLAFDVLLQSNTTDDIMIDNKLPITAVNWNTYSSIENLAPFGMDNQKPLFLFEKAEIVSSKQFGKEKNHLEIVLKNPRGRNVQAIAFFADPSKFGVSLEAGSTIDLVAHLEKSTFRNFPELRLRIVDVL